MGAFKKSAIFIAIAALSTLLIFQNCSNGLHGNGDPYEDAGLYLDDEHLPVSPDLHPDDLPYRSCQAVDPDSKVRQAIFSQTSSNQVLALFLANGRQVRVSWNEALQINMINIPLTSKLTLISAQLVSQHELRLVTKHDFVEELVLDCP